MSLVVDTTGCNITLMDSSYQVVTKLSRFSFGSIKWNKYTICMSSAMGQRKRKASDSLYPISPPVALYSIVFDSAGKLL